MLGRRLAFGSICFLRMSSPVGKNEMKWIEVWIHQNSSTCLRRSTYTLDFAIVQCCFIEFFARFEFNFRILECWLCDQIVPVITDFFQFNRWMHVVAGKSCKIAHSQRLHVLVKVFRFSVYIFFSFPNFGACENEKKSEKVMIEKL